MKFYVWKNKGGESLEEFGDVLDIDDVSWTSDYGYAAMYM